MKRFILRWRQSLKWTRLKPLIAFWDMVMRHIDGVAAWAELRLTNIARRHVMLLDPMLATGGTALAAIQVLLDKGVPEDNIIFINLLTVPEGITAVCRRHPSVKIVTSAIDEQLNENAYMMPGIGDFGDRFFGTDP